MSTKGKSGHGLESWGSSPAFVAARATARDGKAVATPAAFAARERNDGCWKNGHGRGHRTGGGEGPISRDQQGGGVRVPMTKSGLVSRLTTDEPRLQPKSLMQRKKITSAGFSDSALLRR